MAAVGSRANPHPRPPPRGTPGRLRRGDPVAGEGREGAAAVCLLLLGSLLVGFAHIAALPPYEGGDETAHISYVEQLAETGTWPRFGDPLSAETERYATLAPMAFENRWSYRDFFDAPADVVQRGRAAAHDTRDASRPWRAGTQPNWEAQHPPLYYLVLTPFYLISKGWSVAAQLALLRGVSYALAWASLCLALFATWRRTRGSGLFANCLILAPALWPFLFPMWFSEMGRVANDSLVIALAAVTWLVLQPLIASPAGVLRHALLGLLVGCGLLAKATFAPFAAVIGLFLLWAAWLARREPGQLRARLIGLAVFGATSVAVAGWWYVQKFIETGSPIGADDAAKLSATGGLLQGLAERGSFYAFARGLLTLPMNFLWGGTWSFVIPPLLAYAPLALMLVLLCCGFVRYRRSAASPITTADRLAAAVLVALIAGLCIHMVIFIAGRGVGVGLGWYVHSFAPVFVSLLAIALAGVMSSRLTRPVMAALAVYALLFLAGAMIIEVLFFAGCGVQRPGLGYYDFPSAAQCATDLSRLHENLAVLAFPSAALWLFVCGWVSAAAGLALALRLLWARATIDHGALLTPAPLG